jgi:hypothetical protein
MTAAPSDLDVKRSALNVERSGAAGSCSESTAVDSANPWLGLASFTEETRAFFHGRDEEVAELGRRVQRKLLTILFGQSGLGKTSILRAGIVPRLRPEGYCPVYVRLDYGKDSPPPAQQIKDAILRATREAGHWTQTGIVRADESLWEFLHHRDDLLRDRTGRKLIPLLIFDQFEEVFTLAQGDDFGRQRAALFLEELADLVEDRAPRALEADEAGMERFDFGRADYRILIALREDYLAHLEGLKNAMPSVTQNRMRLARMTGVQALAAVTRPGAGLVSEDVARSIVRFVAGGAELERAEVEPSLLSLVCRELNETRRTKGHAEISADLLAGSRDTILTEFYERTLADQPAGVRAFIEDELLTDSGYRESIAEERVKKGFVAAGASPESLATLIDRRLLRVEERLDVRRVELTHDVLVGVVKASRDVRQAREQKEAIERQLAETQAKEAAGRRALGRARLIAAVCAVLAVGALASAIFGYLNLRRARAAETAATASATRARENERLAFASRSESERVVNFLIEDLATDLQPLGRLGLLSNLFLEVLAYYDRLPAELRTPESYLNQATAYARATAISRQLALRAQADEQLARARAALAAAGANADPQKTAQARVEILLAGSGAEDITANFTEGIARAREAVAALVPYLAQSKPTDSLVRLASHADLQLGIALARVGDPEALAWIDRSAELRRSLVAQDESSVRNRQLLGASLGWAAYFSNVVGLPEQAVPRARQAMSILEKLRQEDPSNMAVVTNLGVTLLGLAQGYRAEHRLTEAAEVENQVAALTELRLRVDPSNRTSSNNAMVGGITSAFTRLRSGEVAEALAALRESDAAAVIASTGSTFSKYNLLVLRAGRTEVLAAVGGMKAARDDLASVELLGHELIAAAGPDSAGRADAIQRLESVRRQSALAGGDFATVRSSARESIRVLSALNHGSPADVVLQRNFLRSAQQSLGMAAAEEGDWSAAEEGLRAALTIDATGSGSAMGRVGGGIVSLMSGELAAAARRAELQTWLAWVEANQPGKAADAVKLATEARDFQQHELAGADKSDQALRLAAAFAEVALARARIAAGGNTAEIRTGLTEAERLLGTLSDEFRVTSWVKQVQAKLEKARALAR